MVVVAGLLAAAAARGQHGRDPAAVLEQARARLQAMARNLEKYVCTETINRSYFQRGESTRLDSTDRVRLEVSLAQGRELHSWPGATRFDARDVDALIRNGPVSTGAFGGYLASVFEQPGVTFEYAGEQTVNGRAMFEYRYRVPVEASRFEIKAPTAWRAAAYEGSFQIDPESLELKRLTVRTGELPAGAGFCKASTTLEYERVHIGDSDVVLPRQSELEIVMDESREARNVTTFSKCREYQAESAISFDAPASGESPAARGGGRGRVALPIGLPVALALMEPIDSATAAAGDEIAAKVIKPVRRAASTETLIPAGAIVRGRIRRVEHHLLPSRYFLVAIAFNRVEWQGLVSPFAARSEPDAALVKELDANLALRETGFRFWGVGTFLWRTAKSSTVIPAGFESKWFTLVAGR
uniref:Uncharacterized protein n=1 Tax=Solibacter usitatus (strain Ellin6076) TaxID=234267 RepID=Q01N92_SOLUE